MSQINNILMLCLLSLILIRLTRPIFCVNYINIDSKTCKLTHSGLGYTGTISKTSQGLQCQRWSTLEKLNISFNDEDFADRSIRKAKNFCRNPTKEKDGPWCYIMAGSSPVKQKCSVPLCAYNCRATGPGMEYAGITSNVNFRKCVKWNKKWHKRKVNLPNGNVTLGVLYSSDKFPDKHIISSNNYCRNPDGSLGGPWCYIESNRKSVYIKSYCDVPICDERQQEFVSKQKDIYSHFISYKSSEPNITFAVRLWNPDNEYKAAIKILLSTLSVSASKQNMQKWGTAVEITISNYGTGVTIDNNSQFLEPSSNILKSTEHTTCVVSWKNKVLRLFTSNDANEAVYVQTLADSPLLEHGNISIKYISVAGDIAMWAFPLYNDDECQEHTTFLPSPQFTWKLRQNDVQFFVELSVRSTHSALIFLTCNPYDEYPRISMKISFPKSVTEVVYEPMENVQSQLAITNFLIGYWSWTRLRIDLLGEEVRVTKYDEGTFVPLLAWSHRIVSSLRWFSIGSNRSVTHWTLFCEPPELLAAYPPDCALTTDAVDYRGDHWVSYSGLPCLPWFAVEPRFYKNMSVLNYCRNFKTTMHSSPWCYVELSSGIASELCNIRKCNAITCKKSGTGNDYVGDLSVTRSNLTCKKWPKEFLKRNKQETYPANFFEGNYCRNPTRDVGGAWCFTTGKVIKKDLCDVKDCDKLESRIVITNQMRDFRYTYIIPKWRDSGNNGGLHFALKRWDPFLPEGILFKIYSLDKKKYISLYIGAEYNEELILRFNKDNISKTNVLLVRKIFPHIIPGGAWRGFKLQMFDGGILLKIYYESKDFTILEWKADKPDMMFNPSFISYESIGDNFVGVYFPHTECHIENASALPHSKVYPITWQSDDESSYILKLFLRGTGVATILLVQFPSLTDDYLVILIDDIKKQISLDKNSVSGVAKLCSVDIGKNLLSKAEWNRYDIFSKNNSLYLLRNNIQLLKWDSPGAFVYYFFSVAAQIGWIIWTANCQPKDIDSALQNGGWSPWSNWYCSASCGNGVGYRQRTCDSPEPSIFGKPCIGSTVETGVCNNFNCGHISPQTYNLIRKDLQTKSVNIIAVEGDNIIFESPIELMTQIRMESPNSQIIWIHKGIPLKTIKGKYNVSYFLEVRNISQYDDGLYVCVVKSNTNVNIPIKVVVIAVQPRQPDLIVYNGSSFDMTCTSALPTIYADLWIKWYLNDKLFTCGDIATMYFKNHLKIPLALWNHSGLWKCVMEQTDLNLKWVVQIHKVLVTVRPSLLSPLQAYFSLITLNLMQCGTSPRVYFMSSAVIILILLLFGFSIYCLSNKRIKKGVYKKIPNTDINNLGNKPLSTDTMNEKIPMSDAVSSTKATDAKPINNIPSKANASTDALVPKYMGIKLEILRKGERYKFFTPKTVDDKGKDSTHKDVKKFDNEYPNRTKLHGKNELNDNVDGKHNTTSKGKYNNTYDQKEEAEITKPKGKPYNRRHRDKDDESNQPKTKNYRQYNREKGVKDINPKDKYHNICHQNEDDKGRKPKDKTYRPYDLDGDIEDAKPKNKYHNVCHQEEDDKGTRPKTNNFRPYDLDEDVEDVKPKGKYHNICHQEEDDKGTKTKTKNYRPYDLDEDVEDVKPKGKYHNICHQKEDDKGTKPKTKNYLQYDQYEDVEDTKPINNEHRTFFQDHDAENEKPKAKYYTTCHQQDDTREPDDDDNEDEFDCTDSTCAYRRSLLM